jgi:hypothetical protein
LTPNVDDPQHPALKKYIQRYVARFHKQPTGNAWASLWFYDQLYMTVKAMQLNNSVTKTDKIAQSIATMRWQGAVGFICATKDHNFNLTIDYALVRGRNVKWGWREPKPSDCGK